MIEGERDRLSSEREKKIDDGKRLSIEVENERERWKVPAHTVHIVLKPWRNRAVKILTQNFDNLKFEFNSALNVNCIWCIEQEHGSLPKLQSKLHRCNCSAKCTSIWDYIKYSGKKNIMEAETSVEKRLCLAKAVAGLWCFLKNEIYSKRKWNVAYLIRYRK